MCTLLWTSNNAVYRLVYWLAQTWENIKYGPLQCQCNRRQCTLNLILTLKHNIRKIKLEVVTCSLYRSKLQLIASNVCICRKYYTSASIATQNKQNRFTYPNEDLRISLHVIPFLSVPCRDRNCMALTIINVCLYNIRRWKTTRYIFRAPNAHSNIYYFPRKCKLESSRDSVSLLKDTYDGDCNSLKFNL